MKIRLERGLSRGALSGLALALVLLVVPALLSYQLWLSYRDQLVTAELTTRHLAALLEVRFEAMLRRVDADLTSLIDEIPVVALAPGAEVDYARQIDAELDSRMLKAPEMAGYRVHDAAGRLLYSSDRAQTPSISIADRAYFRQARDEAGDRLVFSDAGVSRVNGRRALVAVRSLRDEGGGFLGTVHGVIDLEHYRQQFESLKLGKGGVVALRRSDGNKLVLRWPELADGVEGVLAQSQGDVTAQALAADASARIVSSQQIADYPFYFSISVDRDEALAGWRSRAWILGASTLSLILLFAYFGLALDRTRRREAIVRSTLERSETQYRHLAKMVPVAVCHVDNRGKCIYVNDRHLALTGRSRDELIGRPWSEMVHPDDLERVRQAWGQWTDFNASLLCEYRLVGAGGQTTHVLAEIRSEVDADGRLNGAIVAQTDISLRKQAEAELLAAKQQAEAANMAKTSFLAAASHDLRQPIQAINLFRDALVRTELSGEQRKIADLLSKSVDSLHELLYALLDISKLDAGQIKPQMSDVRVEELFEAIASESSTLAQRKGLRFKLYYPFKSLVLRTDSGLVLSVLRNLTDNAFKYTDRGGVLVGARRRGGRGVIQVWDTGIGIEAADGERVFDECFQIANPTRDRSKGLGLGLSIARRLARLLQGEVSFRSRPGRGSVF